MRNPNCLIPPLGCGNAPPSCWNRYVDSTSHQQTSRVMAQSTNQWTLEPCHVHVWVWQVSSAPVASSEFAILDQRERGRAERFRPALHRAQWVRSHTGMRRILSGYLGCSPAEVVFRRGPNGKPALDAADPPAFNLSHSEQWCALAVARGLELGLDIQMPHPVNPALWRRVLTPGEQSQMTRIPSEERDAAFFRCWTRKEAVGKADSRGVYVHLKRTETGLLPHAPDTTAVVTATNGSGTTTSWHVADLTLPDGLFGALAASAPAIPELHNLQENEP